LVADIDRGGVFASIYGTIMLLTEEERKRVKGVIINKFRGDLSILEDGLRMIEELTKVPVLGVLPYTHLRIEDEDSLSERFKFNENKQAKIKIEILYLPHVSNFTDFNVFETYEDVQLRYVMRGESIGDPDVLIIPGTKNTIEDLIYLKNTGLAEQIIRLHRRKKRVIGICGGFQMLGKKLSDPNHVESAISDMSGLGLLDAVTTFESEKTTTQVKGYLSSGEGMENTPIKGYEIHMGQTVLGQKAKPFIQLTERLNKPVDVLDGAISDDGLVMGSYIHGLFDEGAFTKAFINLIRQEKGILPENHTDMTFEAFKENEYDKLADLIRRHIDLKKVYEILGEA
jgi:adenosylcobyric acid synthase